MYRTYYTETEKPHNSEGHSPAGGGLLQSATTLIENINALLNGKQNGQRVMCAI
jgi:hypothetical protein